MLKIYPVKTNEDIEIAKTLFEEYADFLKERFYEYFDAEWSVQHWESLEKEIRDFPEEYSSSTGCVLLAEYQGQTVGCVAVKKLSDGICQMKRLYVRDQFRKLGIGKECAKAIIEKGRKLGYHSMRLNTNRLLKAAMELYESLGFKEIAPYEQSLTETSVFMELKL